MIRIVNAALDTFVGLDKVERLIIRGVIDYNDLNEILADKYQREVGSISTIKELADAIETTGVPDVELGMRGENIKASSDGKIYTLFDPTYVIDGLQRLSGGRWLRQEKPESRPKIGATVHLNTTFEWERERFRVLNQERSKLSPNVLLRNMEGQRASIDALQALCRDPKFALYGKVCWQQRKLREQILSANLVCKVVGILHSRFGPGRGSRINQLADGLDRIQDKVGKLSFKGNISDFFEVVDEAFVLRKIVFTAGAPQIKGTFLRSLADVFTRYDDFWTENRLHVSKDWRAKLAKFPIRDPAVAALCSSAGKAGEQLQMMLIAHLNKGRPATQRLKLHDGMDAIGTATEEERAEEE